MQGQAYVYQDRKELIMQQEAYGKELLEHNKFNKLLWLGNGTVAGFLYQKFMEMESKGIKIIYSSNVSALRPAIAIHSLVEMLGILLDNAAEAVVSKESKISVRITSEEDCYCFQIMNPSEYKTYAEIEKWFAKGYSSKGKQRGLGLYRVITLCNENECNIGVCNMEKEQENWIEFRLTIPRIDSGE